MCDPPALPPAPRGRGSAIQPANPYLSLALEPDWQHLEGDEELLRSIERPATVYLPDRSQSIVSQNDSPDISFRYSVNPYRGCAHGCSYCYARPTHEYLGLSAGLDFETRVMVKLQAAPLLRAWLSRPRWVPEPIAFSGVTDCYQPAEREFRLTRACLEVALEARQPVNIITKNALVLRDLDLLRELATRNLVRVAVSITTLDPELARVMEPRTSCPTARLSTFSQLAAAGVSSFVMVAPVIPGLTDSELPAILHAASQAGADGAAYTLLRLPTTVREIYFDWLARHVPSQASRIKNRIRATHDGHTNSSRFGERLCGTGELAEVVGDTFRLFAAKYGLAEKLPPLDCSQFRPPRSPSGQLSLF